MTEEFCHICQEPIEELFWEAGVEEIGPHLERIPKIVKICLDPECNGSARFFMLLQNDDLRLRAMGVIPQ